MSEQNISANVTLNGLRESVEGLQNLKGAFTEAAESGSLFRTALEALENPALAIPGLLGLGVFALDKLGEASLQASERIGKIHESSEALRTTTDVFQTLQAAALSAGVSADTSTNAYERFARGMQQARNGVGPLANDLARIGFKFTADNVDNLEQQVKDLAAALQTSVGKANDLKTATDAFGRGVGPEFVNVLRNIAEGYDSIKQKAKDDGLIYPKEVIERAHEFAIESQRVQEIFDHMKNADLANLSQAAIYWQQIKNSIASIPLSIIDVVFNAGGDPRGRNLSGATDEELDKRKADLLSDMKILQGQLQDAGTYANAPEQYKKDYDTLQLINAELEKRLGITQLITQTAHENAVQSAAEAAEANKMLEIKRLTEQLGKLELDDKLQKLQAQIQEIQEYNKYISIVKSFQSSYSAEGRRDFAFGTGMANSSIFPAVQRDPDQVLKDMASMNDLLNSIVQNVDQLSRQADSKVWDNTIGSSQSILKALGNNNEFDHQKLPFDTWTNALMGFDELVKRHSDDWKHDFEGLFSTMTNGIVKFVTTGKFSFADFTASILTDLAKIATEKAVAGIFGSISSLLGGGFDTSTAAGMANSAAAELGNGISPSARGNILRYHGTGGMMTSGFTQSGSDVYGEANPEAVFPLARDSNGNLGITVSGAGAGGGGGVQIGTVQIVVKSDSQDPSELGQLTGKQFVATINQLVTSKVMDLQRPGNTLYRGI